MNFVDDFLFSNVPEKIVELGKFVNVILHLLGWVLSQKDNQLGDKVKFLGFVLDSTQRRFKIPISVGQKTIKMIDIVIEKIRRDRPIYVSDLQSLTGKLISLKLAIPAISVWLREVYFCFSDETLHEDPQNTRIEVSKKAQESLDRVRMLLLGEPSAPFVSPVSDRVV